MINEDDYIVFEKTEYAKIFKFYKTGYLKSLSDIESLKEKCSQKDRECEELANQIENLNQFMIELEDELNESKKLSKEYSHKLKEFQSEQKMIDELNRQTLELGNMIMNVNDVVAEASKIKNVQEDDLNELENKVTMLTTSLENLRDEKEKISCESAKKLEILNSKLKTVEQAQTAQQDEFRVSFLQQEEKFNKLKEQLEIFTEHENELNANLERANKTIHLLNIEKESSK
jgi:chromosome segregation ATPase